MDVLLGVPSLVCRFITQLYHHPRISPRNFDLFARTVCPPLKARKARVGIEGMIKHLDMRAIAYESSNSLTSRLINRTKSSLESFVPPAVTFSVASLAPLCKCLNLVLLDMSGDHYSFTIHELLGSIRDLESLTSLGLPKDILCEKHSILTGHLPWPRNLAQLLAPGRVPSWHRSWGILFRSWPAALKTVLLPNFESRETYQPFIRARLFQEKAEFVERLEIGVPSNTQYTVHGGTLFEILLLFPRVKSLKIPASFARDTIIESNFPPDVEGQVCENALLENLTIDATGFISWCTEINARDVAAEILDQLNRLLKSPRLRRLEIHGEFLIIDSASKEQALRKYSDILKGRATPDQRAASGIFLLEDT